MLFALAVAVSFSSRGVHNKRQKGLEREREKKKDERVFKAAFATKLNKIGSKLSSS
jgi:hypothetical protein